MGQFYYFAHSDFATRFVADPDVLAPTIARYKLFRDKHAAHRALDYPRREDTPQAQSNYAWALSSMGGMYFVPKSPQQPRDGLRFPDSQAMWLQSYFCLQLFDGCLGSSLDFSVEREHPVIEAEAYQFLELILVAP
jgi:hypothetical protein